MASGCGAGVVGGETATVDGGPDDVVVPGPRGPSRSARRIVAAVAVALVALVGLGWWVLAAPYRVDASGRSVDCDARIGWALDPEARRARDDFERSCDRVRTDRRDRALLIGGGVAVAAAAVSTVPSRRLTGEALGPLG